MGTRQIQRILARMRAAAGETAVVEKRFGRTVRPGATINPRRSRATALRIVCNSALITALCAAIAAPAYAGLVHIQVQRGNSQEFGAGFTVGRGAECFVVTPNHVVQFAPSGAITLTDANGSNATARLVKGSDEFDAALLQVVSGTVECPADWSDGASGSSAIAEAPFLVARKIDDNSRLMQTRLFASSTSREWIELAPFGRTDELREGDSGSAVYAGDKLVALIVSVDTRTGSATALTQSQIHGLFGADVLPGGRRTAVLTPFTYRRAENIYATVAAREFLVANGVDLHTIAASGEVPADTDIVVSGTIVDVTSMRAANPDYERGRPQSTTRGRIGDRLLQQLERRVTSQVDEALQQDREARYLLTYNVDVQIEIHRLSDGRRVTNLERHTLTMPQSPEMGPTELEKNAIEVAVKEALSLTLAKYPL